MKRSLLSFILFFALVFIPSTVFGQALEIPCGQKVDGVLVECNFGHLVELGGNIIDFLIMLSIPLTVLAFIYAGFLMLTAGGNAGQIGKAKGIFFTVLKGFLFVLGAWLIVKTITTALLEEGDFFDLLGYISYYLS